jgi:ketosteroid isomerase-like protein
METKAKKDLIERFVRAYNSFDVDGMMALMHPECSFQNISGGQVTASATGIRQFRELAEKSKALFSTRSQTITAYKFEQESVTVDIDYQGVLRVDLPNGPQAGQTLKFKGKSIFRFRDGLIYELIDQS